jgi:NAD+ diphosphatase
MVKMILSDNMNKKLHILRGIFNSINYHSIAVTLTILLGIYKKYKPALKPDKNNNNPAYWFIFNEDKLLIDTKNKNKIPLTKNLQEYHISPIRTIYLGKLENYPCYAAEVEPNTLAPQKMTFENLRSAYKCLDENIYLLAGRAIQIINWDKNHQFCGKCGTPTQNRDHEMAKICPKCGFMSFPRLSPAVITAIIKNDKILMAKHAYRENMYGLIAGFVEPGETLKECVERETMEEVGLKVKNIKYFGSQPWPYPHSLMIGFTAEYRSGKIKVDGKEITEARWFSSGEIPRSPSKMSIASELIDWFIENNSK